MTLLYGREGLGSAIRRGHISEQGAALSSARRDLNANSGASSSPRRPSDRQGELPMAKLQTEEKRVLVPGLGGRSQCIIVRAARVQDANAGEDLSMDPVYARASRYTILENSRVEQKFILLNLCASMASCILNIQ